MSWIEMTTAFYSEMSTIDREALVNTLSPSYRRELSCYREAVDWPYTLQDEAIIVRGLFREMERRERIGNV